MCFDSLQQPRTNQWPIFAGSGVVPAKATKLESGVSVLNIFTFPCGRRVSSIREMRPVSRRGCIN